MAMLARQGIFSMAVDLRFYGLSDSSDELDATFKGGETWALDLLSVLNSEKVTKAVVVCQSMSGCAGVHLTARERQRVAGLFLSNTNRGIERSPEDVALANELKARLAANPWPEGYWKGVSPKFADQNPGETKAMLSLRELNTGLNEFRRRAYETNEVPLSQVTQFGVPSLVCSSEFDPFFSEDMLKRAAHYLNAQHVHFEDAGHSPFAERPTEW
eukprot:CAMPEP_0172605652 /NCGR_PEP_ID=MMETSP1068-20121228/25885_1 /TAXON_ID=35684 /ORGANISM="Pseudopedinella elastica, Strain CCMP716" /LENGTH=214 /DNA_ID=CAMNT_0013408113 /DNA_START=303 /DNA_END=944 /DNA_ORIENTATION=-